MKRLLVAVSVGVFVGSIGCAMLTVCAPQEVSAKPIPKEINIGTTLAVTGHFSTTWGPKAKAFHEAYEKLINREGGIYVKEYDAELPIKLTIYDDGSDGDRAVELYERLANVDKVNFFLGPGSSPITIRASTVAEKYGIPMVTCTANSPVIYSRGFKWLVGADNVATVWAEYYYGLLKYLMDTDAIPRLKTVAIIASQHPHGMDIAWGAQNLASSAGLEVVAFHKVPPGTTDFTAIITKLKARNPDIIYVTSFPGTFAPLIRQAHEMGLKPFDFHVPHCGTSVVASRKLLGPKLIEGLTGICHDAPYTKGRYKLLEEVREMSGVPPYTLTAMIIHFTAMEALVNAIEKAGTLDRSKVMAALKGLRFEAVYGEFFLRYGLKTGGKVVNGVGNFPQNIIQYQNGKIETLWPLDYSTSTYRPFRP